MSNKDDKTEYDFYHDKKDYITRAALTKMLNEIKAQLSKSRNVKVVLVKE